MNDYIKMDYSLQTPQECKEKTEEILANTPRERLTPRYLEKLADYMLKDFKDTVLTENKLVTVNRRETSFEGLAGKLENGEDGLYNLIANDKNILFLPKKRISQEDLETIPGLLELYLAIQDVEEEFKNATGKRKYLLKRQIIAMRQDQYELRSAFKKPIYSRNTIKSIAKLDLRETVSIDADGTPHSTGTLNLFTPAHVVALLCNYAALKMETWDNFDSDLRWMLIDLENTIERALKDKFPLYYDLLIYKIDGKQNAEIQDLLNQKYHIKYSVEYISALWRNKIPKLICGQAENDYLEWYYTEVEKGKWKQCSRCHEIKLANNRYFSKNNTSKDHFYSICKCCRNKKSGGGN